MIKIKQDNYTNTDAHCLATSIASILENRPEDYPPLNGSENWYLVVNNYLHMLGYNLVLIDNPHISALHGYHLILGHDETTGNMHCVVGKNGTTIHDPSAHRDKFSLPLRNVTYGIISKLFV